VKNNQFVCRSYNWLFILVLVYVNSLRSWHCHKVWSDSSLNRPLLAAICSLYTDSVFSVGIRSVFLGIYHTDTEGKFGRYISVSKRGQSPFFLKRGAMAPFLRSSTPFWKKGGGKGGSIQKRGGSIPTEIPKIQQIWYQQNTDTEKTAGNTAVYNSNH